MALLVEQARFALQEGAADRALRLARAAAARAPEATEPWYVLGICGEVNRALSEAHAAYVTYLNLGGDPNPEPQLRGRVPDRIAFLRRELRILDLGHADEMHDDYTLFTK